MFDEENKKEFTPENHKVIVEEEVKDFDEKDVNSPTSSLFGNKQQKTLRKSIIFKTAESDYKKEGPCLTASPVSIIISNIPSFKGGRANPWMESMQETMGIEDARQQALISHDLENMFVE